MRFLLPSTLLILACAGCTSAEKKAAKLAEKERLENTRLIEERRMRSIDGREIASERAAEIYVADPNKSFDPNTAPGFGSRRFNSKGAQVKDFQYAQRATSGGFRTKDFVGSKSAYFGSGKYATEQARTKDYAGPNAGQTVNTRSADTKDARESGRTVAVREVANANRTYLGPEAAKVKMQLDPNALPRSSNDLRELKTVEDIRELLNKNK